jgi:hypothetical protein
LTDARIGYGTTFALGGLLLTDPFVKIAEVYNVTPPSETIDTIDASHMESPDAVREFIPGMVDPGECSYEMNFVPGSPSETAIIAARRLRQAVFSRITFPNGVTWTFKAFVTGYEPVAPHDDKMTATVTFKVTGTVQFG